MEKQYILDTATGKLISKSTGTKMLFGAEQ